MMLSFFVYIIHASKNATGWAAVFIADFEHVYVNYSNQSIDYSKLSVKLKD